MKTTKREKVLLSVLGALILMVAYYKFALTPQLNKIKELNLEAEEYKDRVQKTKIAISPDNKLHKDFKIMNSKIMYGCQKLFPMIIQEKYIVTIDNMAKDAEIKISSMGFTEKKVGQIEIVNPQGDNNDYLLKELVQQYNNESGKINSNRKNTEDKANDNEDSSKESRESELEKMITTINFEGSYENIINFIENIEDFDKKIVIKNLSLSNPDSGPMVGNIVLDFYAVPRLKNYDYDINYLNWNISNEYGRKNPFEAFSGYVGVNSGDSKNASRKNYDFIMTVKPITSDLPTIIIGKTKDTAMKTYVYADNGNFENVEFEILEEDNKYFYRYKTQSDSWPKEYKNNKIEFKPNGKYVKLNIISHKRNGEKDTSGMNLSLINKSNLQLSIKIDYDDRKKSRVNIIKKIGNINLTR
jgi:type IV pilus assembly protein PilO